MRRRERRTYHGVDARLVYDLGRGVVVHNVKDDSQRGDDEGVHGGSSLGVLSEVGNKEKKEKVSIS